MRPGRRRELRLTLLIGGAALIFMIVGGALIGTSSHVELALLIFGLALLQLNWLPALRGRQPDRSGRASADPARPGVKVLDDHREDV